MKYKIIRSTSNQFNGITFTSDQLTVQAIRDAIQKQGMDILIYKKNQKNEYVCTDGHTVLTIKEEE